MILMQEEDRIILDLGHTPYHNVAVNPTVGQEHYLSHVLSVARNFLPPSN